MFEQFKLKRQIRKVTKQMTDREKAIFYLINSSPAGITKKQIEKTTGYKLSGWVITKFKQLGVQLKVRNNHWFVDEITA